MSNGCFDLLHSALKRLQPPAAFTDSNARPDESFVELEVYFHQDEA
jgi:hypothetical protein